jgi:transposase
MIEHDKYILGIDISKKHFDVALLLPAGKCKNKKFTNNPGGFVKLNSWLENFEVASLHACLEATSTYGHMLAEYLYDQGYDVSMVNPARVKGFAQSELIRTKTDKQDASLIARFCQSVKPALWVPEPLKVRELKALVRRLDALIEMKQQELSRLDVSGEIVAADITDHIELLTIRIDRLRKLIRQHIDDDPGLREQKDLLLTIPGVGEKPVATVLSYFATIERFDNAKQLAAFCGVAPGQSQSGTSLNRRGKMSKVGPSQLRKALFLPAMVALKYNPPLILLRERLTKAGKPKMVSVTRFTIVPAAQCPVKETLHVW